MAQGILKSFYICNKHSESLQLISEKIYVYGSPIFACEMLVSPEFTGITKHTNYSQIDP